MYVTGQEVRPRRRVVAPRPASAREFGSCSFPLMACGYRLRTMSRSAPSFLRIYLRDHHAAACAGVAVAHRAAARLPEGTLTGAMTDVASEIEADLRSLEALMASMDVEPSRSKDVVARLAERVGRLKLNGRVLRRSPLSDVVELETLVIGITGKEALWESLGAVAVIPEDELRALVERAREQRGIVEDCRRVAVRRAFATSDLEALSTR